MDIFDNMCGKIRKRPGFYIGRPSLSLLMAFIGGYSFRQYEITGSGQSYEDFEYFQNYVKAYLGLPLPAAHTGKSAISLILEHCLNDEEKAFYKYFEILDSFKQDHPIEGEVCSDCNDSKEDSDAASPQ